MYKVIKSIKFALAAVIFLGLTSPVFAAKFEFSPASGNLVNGCTYNFVIYADATNESSNAADLIVTYNPAQLEILDSIGAEVGTQVQPGSAYQAYVGNKVDQSGGKITVTAFSVGSNLVDRRPFATLKARPLTNGTVNLQIQFTAQGNTLDSNIADSSTSLDILASVTNASFNIISGTCAQDTTPPVVQFISPKLNETGFAGNVITLQISDAGSGVQLSSVQIVINGVSYNINSPEVSYQPVNDGYSFTITLPESIESTESGNISVKASDINGNQANAVNLYNQPGGVVPGECVVQNNFFATGNPEYIFKNTFLENTFIHNTTIELVRNYGAALPTAILIATALLILTLRFLPWFAHPAILIAAVGIIFGRKQNRIWGAVFDKSTKLPLAWATVKLKLKDTSHVVSRTVTNAKGYFGFDIEPGEYEIVVSRFGFTSNVRDFTLSPNTTAPNQKMHLISYSLLDSRTALVNKILIFINKLLGVVSVVLILVGLLIASLSLATNVNILSVLVFVVYLSICLLWIRHLSIKNTIDSFVVETVNNYRLPNLNINVYDLEAGQLVDTLTTNVNGSFDYFGEPGEYGLELISNKVRFVKSDQNFKSVKKMNLLVAKLQTANNKLQLYAQEIAENSVRGNNVTT